MHEYHCAAFNALAEVVIHTQSKESFFFVFFFKEVPERAEIIWENIVDISVLLFSSFLLLL